MREWVLSGDDLEGLIDSISAEWDLYAPQRKGRLFEFRRLRDFEDLCIEYPLTMIPPSSLFAPGSEVLYHFDPDRPAEIESVDPARPIALFGVHPCDLAGIAILDELHLSPPIDRCYANRRSGSFLVAVECAAPCVEESLCADKETYRARRTFDLLLIPSSGDRWFLRSGSEAGDDVARSCRFLRPATYEDRCRGDEESAARNARFKARFGLDAPTLSARVEASWDDLLWSAQSRLCLSCGACNAVCPTCHCYAVDDVLPVKRGESGERRRRRTGCQLADFAVVAGVENFRGEKAFRLRHRIFKKEVYLVERLGRSGCVGCGRCGHFCPAGIRLVEIFRQISGEEKVDA